MDAAPSVPTDAAHPHGSVLLLWLVYGVLLLGVLGIWLLYVDHVPSVLAYAYRYDFLSVYIGARAVVTGHGAAVYDLALQRTLTDAAIAPFTRSLLLPFIYPAYMAVALAPLGALPYPVAFVLWDLINVAIVARVLFRLVPSTAARRDERIALVLIVASFVPLLLGLLQGQFQLVVLLGLVEMVLALRAGHERRAGAWLLLGLAKPHLILLPLLALLLARRWRTLAVFIAGSAAVLAGSLMVVGNWLLPYLRLLTGFSGSGEELSNYPDAMSNWRGLLTVLSGGDQGAVTLGLLIGLDLLGVAAIVALYLRAPGRGVATGRPATTADEVRMAGAILAGLLISPYLYLHDTVPALLAGCMLWRAGQSARADGMGNPVRLRLLDVLLVVGPLAAYAAQIWVTGIGPVQVGPWYMTILLVAVFWAWSGLLHRRAPSVAEVVPAGAPVATREPLAR